MRVEEGKYSIAEIVDWYRSKVIVVNREYQRGGRLWPPHAKSYFIDTILNQFPFPKIYLQETLDRVTKRPRREIVDGQQRISTIVEFIDGGFALGRNAGERQGMRFEDLGEEAQHAFFSYVVSADVIRNAERAQILQMFRRMNAFTLPLNSAEKRHSEYFGQFKDWVNTMLDEHGTLLVNWNVLTSRQVLRMADAEFIADLALAIDEGIVSTSPTKLAKLYRKYDGEFPTRDSFSTRIGKSLDTLLGELSDIQDTYLTKTHVFHSLTCALIHNRYGLVGAEELTGLSCIERFLEDRESAVACLRRLAVAHEERDTSEFAEYVLAASEGGNRLPQRAVRLKWLCQALRGRLDAT